MKEDKKEQREHNSNYTEVAGPLLFMIIVIVVMIVVSHYIG